MANTNNTREQGRLNNLTGKAGECSVAAQLFLRGLPVAFSLVDMGVDLHAINGCRIQVKSAHVSATPKALRKLGPGCYFFPLPKVKRVAINDRQARLNVREVFSKYCDVVVFWGIEGNRYWVVPAALAERSSGLILGADDPGRFVGNVKEMRDMLSLGYSRQEIASHHGIDRTTVHNLLKSPKDFQGPSVTSLVRQCENAWEHIFNFSRAATNVADEDAQPSEVRAKWACSIGTCNLEPGHPGKCSFETERSLAPEAIGGE